MARITAETIEKICTRDGKFYVPERIQTSIEGCLANDDEDAITKEYLRLLDEFQKYEKSSVPVIIDYRGALTLDAYTAYYLSRNMFIPLIAFRDLAFHPFFHNIPDSLSVLDLGSGTGAVVLGLLSLFSTSPLSRVAVNMTALDCCAEALDRQKSLIEKAGFNSRQVHHYKEDLCDIDSCMKLVTKEGPYYLIFLANCLTELERDVATELVGRLPELLTDNGAIIIAEAQRNYTKALVRSIAAKAPGWGLQVYYPCPGGTCPYTFPYDRYCMTWRYHEYEVPDIKVKDSPLSGDTKDKLTASWLILTKQNVSIYDSLKREGQDLEWGPISKAYSKYRSICSGGHVIDLSDDGLFSRYKRGHIVGLSNEHEVVEHYAL